MKYFWPSNLFVSLCLALVTQNAAAISCEDAALGQLSKYPIAEHLLSAVPINWNINLVESDQNTKTITAELDDLGGVIKVGTLKLVFLDSQHVQVKLTPPQTGRLAGAVQSLTRLIGINRFAKDPVESRLEYARLLIVKNYSNEGHNFLASETDGVFEIHSAADTRIFIDYIAALAKTETKLICRFGEFCHEPWILPFRKNENETLIYIQNDHLNGLNNPKSNIIYTNNIDNLLPHGLDPKIASFLRANRKHFEITNYSFSKDTLILETRLMRRGDSLYFNGSFRFILRVFSNNRIVISILDGSDDNRNDMAHTLNLFMNELPNFLRAERNLLNDRIFSGNFEMDGKYIEELFDVLKNLGRGYVWIGEY